MDNSIQQAVQILKQLGQFDQKVRAQNDQAIDILRMIDQISITDGEAINQIANDLYSRSKSEQSNGKQSNKDSEQQEQLKVNKESEQLDEQIDQQQRELRSKIGKLGQCLHKKFGQVSKIINLRNQSENEILKLIEDYKKQPKSTLIEEYGQMSKIIGLRDEYQKTILELVDDYKKQPQSSASDVFNEEDFASLLIEQVVEEPIDNKNQMSEEVCELLKSSVLSFMNLTSLFQDCEVWIKNNREIQNKISSSLKAHLENYQSQLQRLHGDYSNQLQSSLNRNIHSLLDWFTQQMNKTFDGFEKLIVESDNLKKQIVEFKVLVETKFRSTLTQWPKQYISLAKKYIESEEEQNYDEIIQQLNIDYKLLEQDLPKISEVTKNIDWLISQAMKNSQTIVNQQVMVNLFDQLQIYKNRIKIEKSTSKIESVIYDLLDSLYKNILRLEETIMNKEYIKSQWQRGVPFT